MEMTKPAFATRRHRRTTEENEADHIGQIHAAISPTLTASCLLPEAGRAPACIVLPAMSATGQRDRDTRVNEPAEKKSSAAGSGSNVSGIP